MKPRINLPNIEMGVGFVRGPKAQFARAQAQKERLAKYLKHKIIKIKT